MSDEEQEQPFFAALEETTGVDSWSDESPVEQNEPRRPVILRNSSRDLLQAHTALLDHEVVSVHVHPEAFRQIRAHYAALEHWHEQHTGWRVQRGSAFFRLERHLHAMTPVFTDDRLKRPRDFVCLAWVLWFAEKRHLAGGGRNQQFLLSELGEALQEQSKIVAGAEHQLDFRNQHDRYSMWRALDYLTRLGAVQALEGETKKWVEDAPDNEVLYEFTPISHSLVEAVHEKQIAALASYAADDAQRLQPGVIGVLAETIPPLHRAWRTLLLGPALLRYDDPAAFTALAHHTEAVSDEVSEVFGWLLELNSDYACIVRGGSLSVGSGPTLAPGSAHDQMILLLCSAFRQRVEAGTWIPDSYGCLRVAQADIAEIFTELRQRYGMHWGSGVQATKATELLEEIYQRMRRLGFLRGPDAAGECLILPTAARYSVSYAEEAAETRSRPPRSKAKTAASKTKTSHVERTTLWDATENAEGATR